jgi:hypothetical protein
MNIEFEVWVSLVPIFADRNYSQIDPNYYKILVDNEGNVLKKRLDFYKTIEDCLFELYTEYLKIDYDWCLKSLYNCNKNNKTIDITYLCKMPYIKDCERDGVFINVNEFMSTVMDEYYVKIVTSNSPESFR